jgi:hypothetical protein
MRGDQSDRSPVAAARHSGSGRYAPPAAGMLPVLLLPLLLLSPAGAADNRSNDDNGNVIIDFNVKESLTQPEKDSDGDGILDSEDSDDNNDGIPDILDNDDDGDGIMDWMDDDDGDGLINLGKQFNGRITNEMF